MRASSDGVMRGGEPVSAFLAILDREGADDRVGVRGSSGRVPRRPDRDAVETRAGRRLGPSRVGRSAIALGGGEQAPGASLTVATRGTTPLPVDSLLVVVSSALRGTDDERWREMLRENAPASGRLASVLVELALRAGDPTRGLARRGGAGAIAVRRWGDPNG